MVAKLIDIAIVIFILLETSNVLIIYFHPEFKYGNSLRAFKQWEELKKDEHTSLFVRYMANWVASCKLIFIALLIVILFTASDLVKIISVAVLIPAVSAYYFKLYPLIRKLDNKEQITPKGYSKTQFIMITMIIAIFAISLITYFI